MKNSILNKKHIVLRHYPFYMNSFANENDSQYKKSFIFHYLIFSVGSYVFIIDAEVNILSYILDLSLSFSLSLSPSFSLATVVIPECINQHTAE